jgi:hypothetical protein
MHDELYLALSAHILYLLFPDYGSSAIPAKLIIDKLVKIILGCKTTRIEIILMLI